MTKGRRFLAPHSLLGFFGVILIIIGVVIVAIPLFQVHLRGQADATALSQWNTQGTNSIKGAVPGTSNATHLTCSGSNGNYALVSFTGLPQYAYAGVAGDGDWSLLNTRSMVHWHGSAAPGQLGNMMVAFHREPDYEHIDQLGVGQIVTVQNQTCQTFQYKITQKWVLPPSQVNQLVNTPTATITLVTCTPFWQDYNRIVWRGTLITPASSASPAANTSPVPVPSPHA